MDTFPLLYDAALTPGNPIYNVVIVCSCVIVLCWIASTATGNYSQVDKLWSIIPWIYTWIVVVDQRTILMSIVATIWGIRLTYNFSRRGGYKWPPWTGDEDYRWSYVQNNNNYIPLLRNRFVWFLFNIIFISIYQHILLLLIISPSLVAYIVATTTQTKEETKLNILDYIATILVVTFITIETIADNQQYAFQTEKYRQRNANIELIGDYKDGFYQSGLFAVVRKPNFAAEQAIWISYYLYSVAATSRWWNWSCIGWILLILLFQETGKLTEHITCEKYPAYRNYQQRVPRYIPRLLLFTSSSSATKKSKSS